VSRTSEAYTALTLAMEHTPAECADVDLFIADDLNAADTVALRATCDACPVLGLCDAYASVARPLAGYWAGHRAGYYRAVKNRKSTKGKAMPIETYTDPKTGFIVQASRNIEVKIALPPTPIDEVPLAPNEPFKVDRERLGDHEYYLAHKADILKLAANGEL